MAMRHPPKGGTALSAWPLAYARAWLARLVDLQVVDRATALAGLAFTALVPLFIVYDALVPAIDRRDFAAELIDRFALRGAAAASVRDALTPPGTVEQTLGVVGVALVLVSALSFARALQRLYEAAFGLSALGSVRGAPSTLLWLALIPVFVTLTEATNVLLDGPAASAVALAFAAGLWTVSPFVLLARRLPWRRLVATGVLTAIAMSALGTATALWMTRSVTDSAARYGLMGVAFALLSWMILAGFVLVGSAAAGAVIGERARPRVTRTG